MKFFDNLIDFIFKDNASDRLYEIKYQLWVSDRKAVDKKIELRKKLLGLDLA